MAIQQAHRPFRRHDATPLVQVLTWLVCLAAVGYLAVVLVGHSPLGAGPSASPTSGAANRGASSQVAKAQAGTGDAAVAVPEAPAAAAGRRDWNYFPDQAM
jgi:hypothetical protein